MWQRQPHRADLLPSRSQVVDDASRDDEVRFCVVVAEYEAGPEKDNPGHGSRDRSGCSQQPFGASGGVRYNHEATQSIVNLPS